MSRHTTSVFILAILAIILGYDAFAVAFGWHASISECITDGLHQSTLWALVAGLIVGVLLGHWWFSVDYNKPK